MQSNKSLFFLIVGASIMLVVVMVVARQFLFESLDIPAGARGVDIEVVVAPSIKPWVDQAARDFNQAHPDTQVSLKTANELAPLSEFQATSGAVAPPAAWLAEASFVVELVAREGVQFDEAQSVAGTSMAWGAYNSKLDQFNQDYGDLNWENIHNKGTNADDVLKLVIASPQNSAEGVAALISAVAGHVGKDTLAANDISAAGDWLTETFGNRNTQIPATPAVDFATKGLSAGDIGILSMASWRGSNLTGRSDFTITPTQPGVTLDFPYVVWSGSSPQAKATATAFRDFLLQEAQQAALGQYNLDTAGATPGGVQIDGNAAQRLLDWTNRGLR